MSRTAIIADSHLGGPGGGAGPFVAQLERLVDEGLGHLVLLGDIFHVWVGSPRFETALHREVLTAIGALRRRGVRVDYIEGNRDFFIDRSPYASSFDRITTELTFQVGERSCLAVHGDGLDDRDLQYRFWRWLSKSRPVRTLVLGLPAGVARRLVARTEEQLARTNFKHRRRIPEEVVQRYGARRLDGDPGFDVLYLGHFHEPRRWTTEGGREIRLVDAWFHRRHVEWVDV